MDKIIRLCCTIEAPRARAGEALDVITAQLAGIIASIGLTVGVVGVVAGEEPVLTAFAPMRDLIAPRIRDALGGGTAHSRQWSIRICLSKGAPRKSPGCCAPDSSRRPSPAE